jgi:hypothetical protein
MQLGVFISLALLGCASLIYMLAKWLREPRSGTKRFRPRHRYF